MTPQALAALHAAAFTGMRAWSAQEFSNLLSYPGTFAAGDQDSFVLIRTVADEAEVLTLATTPAKRRQGLARATLRKGEDLAKSLGASTVFLEVAEDNVAGINLYATSGYREVGRRPRYYTPDKGAPIAALILRKSLT